MKHCYFVTFGKSDTDLMAPQPTRPERLANDSMDTNVVVNAPVTILGSAPAKISVIMFLPAPE